MPFNMAYFKKQAELKRQQEEAAAKARGLSDEEAKKVANQKLKDEGNYFANDDEDSITNYDEHEKIGVSSKSKYYKFHVNSNAKDNPHYFLCEELLSPRVNNSDTQRLNMFSNHINQFVHLKAPEFPKVFTNFEDQIGDYSVAYKKADDSCDIIAKIIKNAYNYDLIVKYHNSGIYDIIHYNMARNITESYGYKLNDCVPDAKVGDTIKKDQFIYKSDNYDKDGNFSYGVNLKAAYIAWKNLSFEDKNSVLVKDIKLREVP